MSSILTKFKTQGWLNDCLGYWDTGGGQEAMFNLTQLFVKSFLGGTYNKTILKESTQTHSPINQVYRNIMVWDAKAPGD